MISDQNELVENRNLYVVQKILKRRLITKGNTTRIEYYVKWENYDSDDNTWEPAQNLATVPQMIEKFQKKLTEKKQAQNNKQTSKNRLWGNDSEQNVSQNEDRYERENGSKLRKQQSGTKNSSQLAQHIKQTKAEIPNTRQTTKQTKQIPRKHRNVDSNSDFGIKSKNLIEVEDNQDLKIQKEPQIKKIKQKQLKINPQKDSNDKKQKAITKREEQYGKIVNHVYRDGQLFFQVQRLSNTQKVMRIQPMTREEVEKSCIQGAYQYFYKLLVSLQEART